MKAKQWALFLLLGFIWSSSFMWIKVAVADMGPSTLVTYRTFFGVMFGVAAIIYTRTTLPRTFESWKPLLILGITNISIPFFLVSWSESSIDSGMAAILNSTAPLFALVGAHVILPDDKITLAKVTGLILGFVGIIVLMSGGRTEQPTTNLLAQLASVLASAFYAGSSIYARKYTQKTPSLVRSSGPLLSATLFMAPIAAFTEAPFRIPVDANVWFALMWLGIIGSGVAFLLSYYLIHEIGPTRASMVTYLFPLGGVTLGVIFLDEEITWRLIVGALLVSLSLVVANLQAFKSSSS